MNYMQQIRNITVPSDPSLHDSSINLSLPSNRPLSCFKSPQNCQMRLVQDLTPSVLFTNELNTPPSDDRVREEILIQEMDYQQESVFTQQRQQRCDERVRSFKLKKLSKEVQLLQLTIKEASCKPRSQNSNLEEKTLRKRIQIIENQACAEISRLTKQLHKYKKNSSKALSQNQVPLQLKASFGPQSNLLERKIQELTQKNMELRRLISEQDNVIERLRESIESKNEISMAEKLKYLVEKLNEQSCRFEHLKKCFCVRQNELLKKIQMLQKQRHYRYSKSLNRSPKETFSIEQLSPEETYHVFRKVINNYAHI